MSALIIQTNEDGTVSIAAPAQIPPELLADAETVASLEEAAQIVQDVLGADMTGGKEQDAPMDAGTGQLPTSEGGAPQAEAEDPDAAMEQGFTNVRGARR